jgi:hypothetical protein
LTTAFTFTAPFEETENFLKEHVGMCPKRAPLTLMLKVKEASEWIHSWFEIWGLRFVVGDRGGFLEMRLEIVLRTSERLFLGLIIGLCSLHQDGRSRQGLRLTDHSHEKWLFFANALTKESVSSTLLLSLIPDAKRAFPRHHRASSAREVSLRRDIIHDVLCHWHFISHMLELVLTAK